MQTIFRMSFLFGVHILSFFHKLRHDLARELVVAFCSLILLALFYYIFNDFLNLELRSISDSMRQSFAHTFTIILLLASSFGAGRLIRAYFINPRSLHRTVSFMGEHPKLCQTLAVVHTMMILALIYVPTWVLIDLVLVQWSLGKKMGLSVLMVLASLSLYYLPTSSKQDDAKEWPLRWSQNSQQALVEWRLQLLFLRNRLTQFCFLLSFVCALTLIGVAYLELPFVAAFPLAFWGGFMGACALCFQFADDLQSSAIEKSSGVSHESFLSMLFIISFLVGSLLGFTTSSVWWLTEWLHHTEDKVFIGNALKLFFITAVPCWTVPAILFQIDARRPVLSILTSFLISLFVTTAIYASWFATALIPVLIYYGVTSQEGRFYRA